MPNSAILNTCLILLLFEWFDFQVAFTVIVIVPIIKSLVHLFRIEFENITKTKLVYFYPIPSVFFVQNKRNILIFKWI